jgi:hypothetical protein
MTDYILKFPSKDVAEAFGLAHGFAHAGEDGAIVSTLASHEHALHEVGEHNGDGQYWVLFRDLVDIPVPDGAEQFIYWSSKQTFLNEDGVEIGVPRPFNNPDVPNIWWG